MPVCPYLTGAEGDHTDVFAEGALLNLVDKLSQLGVSATAVVNLKTNQTHGYDRHILKNIKEQNNVNFK